jgi:hypothetical protein
MNFKWVQNLGEHTVPKQVLTIWNNAAESAI